MYKTRDIIDVFHQAAEANEKEAIAELWMPKKPWQAMLDAKVVTPPKRKRILTEKQKMLLAKYRAIRLETLKGLKRC